MGGIFKLAGTASESVDAGMRAKDESQDGKELRETPVDLIIRGAGEARRFFRGDGEAGLRVWWVVAAGCETLPAGCYALRRDFLYHAVEYTASGRGAAEVGRVAGALTAGRVYATGPETRLGLRVETARPMRRYYLWLAGPGAAAVLAEAGLGGGRVRAVSAPGEIREAWEWLLRDGGRSGARGAALAHALTEVLLLKLADARDASAPGAEEGARATYERCRALADAEAARMRGAADLAAAAGLRTETVCRLFRRFADTTPGAYLRTRRMRLAAERLRAPGARVKEVAAELGFADAFHFSRVFKAEVGVAPRDWRAGGVKG